MLAEQHAGGVSAGVAAHDSADERKHAGRAVVGVGEQHGEPGKQRAQIDGVGIAWRGTAMSRGTYTGHPGNVSGRVIAHQTSSSSASLALTISSTCPVYLLVVLSSSPSARRTSSSPTSPSLASRSSASLACRR